MSSTIADALGRIPLSANLMATLTRAAGYAGAQQHREVALEHLLLALTEDPDAALVLSLSNVEIDQLKGDVSSHIGRMDDRVTQSPIAELRIASELKDILAAAAAAAEGRRNEIDGAIVLAAIVGEGKSTSAHLLRAHGMTFETAIRALQQAATARSAPAGTSMAAPPANAAAPAPAPHPAPNAAPAQQHAQPTVHHNSQTAEEILASARQRVQGRIAPGLPEIQHPENHHSTGAAATGPATTSPAASASSGLTEESVPPRAAETIRESSLAAAERATDAEFERITAEAVAAAAASPAAGAARQPVQQPAPEPHQLAPAPPEARPAPPADRPLPPGALRPAPAPRVRPDAQPVAAGAPNPNTSREPSTPPGRPQPPPAMPAGPPPMRGPQHRHPPADAAPPLPGAPSPGAQFERAPPPGATPPGLPPNIARGPLPPPPGAWPGPPGRGIGHPGGAIANNGHSGVDTATRPPPPAGASPVAHPSAHPGPGMVPRTGPPPEQHRRAPPLAGAPGSSHSPSQSSAPAPAPAMPAPMPSHRGGPAPTVAIGQIVENIPRAMRVAVPRVVEARIARADVKTVSEGLQGGGGVRRHEINVTKAMSVRLRAPDGGFSIESSSPDTQWIENVHGLMSDEFASWRWTVTPKARGRRRLQLIVSARTVGSDGLAAETVLPEQIIEVRVRTNYALTLRRLGGWAIAAIAGGLLAHFGQELPQYVEMIKTSIGR